MRKLLAYFRVTMAEAFVYRATGFIWMLNDTLPGLIALLFWSAAFQGQALINGYSQGSMSFYYLGVILIDGLVFSYPEFSLMEGIRSGSFSNYLLKPFNLVWFHISDAIAWRLVRVLFFLPLGIGAWYLFVADFALPLFSWWQICLFSLSIILAFIIIVFIKMIFGLSVIWLTEAGWLLFSFDILTGLFSGELIPLDFLPAQIVNINNWLPFKYFIYFPLSILLNLENSPTELTFSFSVAIFWAVFFFWFYRRLLKAGIKNYGAFGG